MSWAAFLALDAFRTRTGLPLARLKAVIHGYCIHAVVGECGTLHWELAQVETSLKDLTTTAREEASVRDTLTTQRDRHAYLQ